MPTTPVTSTRVERITCDSRQEATDLVAVEEPLQIVLEHGGRHERKESPLAITMRTPGHDRDLVVGFLHSERVIGGIRDLAWVRRCSRDETRGNVIRVSLKEHVVVPPRLLERNLTVTSACGVCGERSVEALSDGGCEPIPIERHIFEPEAIRQALASLEASQVWFRHTGGTHGAALFNQLGTLLLHREDVGRHNALDKLVGAWVAGPVAAPEPCFVVVSSRASFELVHKTLRGGFPMLVAIGAPSSLAIEAARRFGLTLVGFARRSRFNVYAGGGRLAADPKLDLRAVE